MKCLGLSSLTLLIVLSVGTSAQDNPFSKTGQGLAGVQGLEHSQPRCPDYKIIIVTPPANLDFKMQVNTPAKNIDPGIVMKPCEASDQLAAVPQIIAPREDMAEYLKGLLKSRKNKIK